MGFHDLLGFLMVLRESQQILPKNNKLMTLVTLVSLLLSSILLFIFAFSSYDIALKATSAPISPTSSNLTHLKVLFALFCTFLLCFLSISFFTSIAIIIISRSSYCNKTLSAKDLLPNLVKSWTRPLITVFYTTLLVLGYFSLFFTLFSLFRAFYQAPVALIIILLMIGIPFLVFYIHLSVVLILAMVISVIEEKYYGIEALGKAALLIKGNRLNGFLLNIFFILLCTFLYLVAHMGGKSTVFSAFSSLCFAYVVKILVLMAYTVLYFHCKKEHGEEIEFQESGAVNEYSKLSSLAYEEA